MKTFILKVKHDNGTVNLRTVADSEDSARQLVMKAEGCPDRAIISVKEAKQPKYRYLKVIQQYYGQGWEDVSEYETNSGYWKLEQSEKLSPTGKKESLLSHDLREYKIMGYPTRVIRRRELNS